MKLGVVARAELRGLGIQTRAVADALDADRVLLVEPRPASWQQRDELLAHHNVTKVAWKWGGQLHPEKVVRDWLEGLTVVYTAETPYDARLPMWAAKAGCALVRHANPEQLGPEEIIDGDPTVWWSATDWRLDKLPPGTRVVPMPVDLPAEFDRGLRNRESGRPLRFVHSMGHAAAEDRAGTQVVSQAVRRLKFPARVDVFCQDRRLDVAFKSKVPGMDIRVHERGVADQWDQYRASDVLVLPRRYGGLSLPSLEALAAGLVLVMTDCSPNRVWPGPKVTPLRWRPVRMRCGWVDVCDPDPVHLAVLMNDMVRHPEQVDKWKTESRSWAEANSWEALRPLWLAELGSASSSLGRAAVSTGKPPAAGSSPG